LALPPHARPRTSRTRQAGTHEGNPAEITGILNHRIFQTVFFERLDVGERRGNSAAGVSRLATGERTDAQKVKGLSHHGQTHTTIGGQMLST